MIVAAVADIASFAALVYAIAVVGSVEIVVATAELAVAASDLFASLGVASVGQRTYVDLVMNKFAKQFDTWGHLRTINLLRRSWCAIFWNGKN